MTARESFDVLKNDEHHDKDYFATSKRESYRDRPTSGMAS
jgi:hypothetical protein